MNRTRGWRGVAAAVAIAGSAGGCVRDDRPLQFNPLVTAPATSPAPAQTPPPEPGTSTVTMRGEINLGTDANFYCTTGWDDHFIRGSALLPDGSRVHLSVEVDTRPHPKPGTYRGTVRILVRRVVGEFYASWYHDAATMTVLPKGRGADLPTVTLKPEPGTGATREIVIGGHFGCVERKEG